MRPRQARQRRAVSPTGATAVDLVVAVDAAKVRRLRSDGLSWRGIAAEIGVPKDTLLRSVLGEVEVVR